VRCTSEPWFDHDLTICQPEDGYRFTIDPVILCAQVVPRPGDHILDLGCGCGIMPLILGYRYPRTRITGVDTQETLTDIATLSVAANQMQGRIRILNEDINRLTLKDIGSPADIIISNPPYKKMGTGRMNPHQGKAIARHELLVTIDQIFAAASSLLAPDGRLNLIFPADRSLDLMAAASASGFYLEHMRPVQQSNEVPPFRMLISAVKTRTKDPKRLPPLILFQKDNLPTKAHQALFNP